VRGREWLSFTAIAVVVVAAGAAELNQVPLVYGGGPASVVFLLFLGVAVGIARREPALALALAWLAGTVQALEGLPILLTEASLAVVLFAAARWGRPVTGVLAGASVVFIPLLALAWVRVGGVGVGVAGQLLYTLLGRSGLGLQYFWLLLFGLALLGIPYLLGLSLRFQSGARTAQEAQQSAERDASQAQEIARLQEAQNQLARDVHDVVGHSLTVILAQAESAQFIEDPEKLKQTMQTIAGSARTSLQDVRQVLTPGQELTAARRGGLEALIEEVRASGHPLVATEVGEPRPLPPELDAVAYRVLQEMLTNAIKHGSRDRAIVVDRRWPPPGGPALLRIQVRNIIDTDATQADATGQGLFGMRRRLAAVGGALEVQRAEDAGGPTFTVIASVPVRGVS
jgi:signal transduction histidine kinase